MSKTTKTLLLFLAAALSLSLAQARKGGGGGPGVNALRSLKKTALDAAADPWQREDALREICDEELRLAASLSEGVRPRIRAAGRPGAEEIDGIREGGRRDARRDMLRIIKKLGPRTARQDPNKDRVMERAANLYLDCTQDSRDAEALLPALDVALGKAGLSDAARQRVGERVTLIARGTAAAKKLRAEAGVEAR